MNMLGIMTLHKVRNNIFVNVRVLGEEADKQNHIPDASKKVHK